MQNIQIELKTYYTRSAIESLDLYVRMYLGQFDAIKWLYQMNARKLLTGEEKENWNAILLHIRDILYPELSAFKLNASRGISNVMNKPEVLDAYNLKCVIRSRISWVHHPEGGWTANFYSPDKPGRCPIARCTVTSREGVETVLLVICSEQKQIMRDAAKLYLDVLNGNLSDAFGLYTSDAEALALAAQAEKYYPGYIRKTTLANAEEYYDYIRGM